MNNGQWGEVRVVGDVAAAGIGVAAYLEYLPSIAALLTIAYTALRIWESKTVQGWIGNKKPNLPSED